MTGREPIIDRHAPYTVVAGHAASINGRLVFSTVSRYARVSRRRRRRFRLYITNYTNRIRAFLVHGHISALCRSTL